jgi:hypothetical protein
VERELLPPTGYDCWYRKEQLCLPLSTFPPLPAPQLMPAKLILATRVKHLWWISWTSCYSLSTFYPSGSTLSTFYPSSPAKLDKLGLESLPLRGMYNRWTRCSQLVHLRWIAGTRGTEHRFLYQSQLSSSPASPPSYVPPKGVNQRFSQLSYTFGVTALLYPLRGTTSFTPFGGTTTG